MSYRDNLFFILFYIIHFYHTGSKVVKELSLMEFVLPHVSEKNSDILSCKYVIQFPSTFSFLSFQQSFSYLCISLFLFFSTLHTFPFPLLIFSWRKRKWRWHIQERKQNTSPFSVSLEWHHWQRLTPNFPSPVSPIPADLTPI